jgi:IS30 family transposase
MSCARRPRMSWAQKSELWRRWHRGETLSEIGRALDRLPASVFSVLRMHGGFAPAVRQRSRLALTTTEREAISRGIARGDSLRLIAAQLDRAPSTISRELARNGGRRWYRAVAADRHAWKRSRRPKACRLITRPRLRAVVAGKLAAKWSPEQIAGWLRDTFPGDADMQVSHETIYRSLFVQSRGVLKRQLL